jgi:hypothetical protein
VFSFSDLSVEQGGSEKTAKAFFFGKKRLGCFLKIDGRKIALTVFLPEDFVMP